MPPLEDANGRSFTLRSVAVGLFVGTVICAANVYFGLQTGWVSIMSMPASLMGFGIFKTLQPLLTFPFSAVENVLLQSVAGGMAVMPLGCGIVGVIPAMNYLLEPEEYGPINFSTTKLIIWSLGLCYFGVVFAVPLRRQVIVREKLKFPSGFSTAVLISVLHGHDATSSRQEQLDRAARGGYASLVYRRDSGDPVTGHDAESCTDSESVQHNPVEQFEWASNMRLLVICFVVSGALTVSTFFYPVLRNIPVFGSVAASQWLWTFNPSLAYVGQGLIMGPETTLHMTLGAAVGWGLLSPLAKSKGWAPGPVNDWEHGSKGWIVWISLAIMLVDAVVSLGYAVLRPLGSSLSLNPAEFFHHALPSNFRRRSEESCGRYTLLQDEDDSSTSQTDMTSEPPRPGHNFSDVASDVRDDAPADHRIGKPVVITGLISSVLFCVGTTHFVFGDLVPLYAIIIAVLMALLLSIMGVRALGETDLNPVSGISKLAQLFFALIVPQSNQRSVIINLVAGAVSEAGALQAGDLMQDLKTGHLLGAAPKAQFWGQIIGATTGAILSAYFYKVYTSAYDIPGDLFPVPTAYVWVFTARLVTGQGLPYMAKECAFTTGAIIVFTTLLRIVYVDRRWRSWIPGGIAVAIGMYNVPSFTLARALGGVLCWYWTAVLKKSDTQLIILASGFILGEGFLSVVNLALQQLKIPHL